MKRISLLITALVITIGSFSQKEISLETAIRSAIQNKNSILAARSAYILDSLDGTDLKARYRPKASLEYAYQFNPVLATSIVPVGQFAIPATDKVANLAFGTRWQQSAGLKVTQLVHDFSFKASQLENSFKQKVSQLDKQQLEYELTYEVAKTYLGILLLQDQQKTASTDTARTYNSFQLQDARFKEGKLLRSDWNKALLNHNNSVQAYEDYQFQINEQKAYLSYLMGVGADKSYSSLILEPVPDSLLITQQTESATSTIPLFGKLKAQQESYKQAQLAERKKNLPIIELSGFLGANQFTNNIDPFNGSAWFGVSNIALNAKWNIFNGENRQSRLRKYDEQIKKLEADAKDQELNYSQEALRARENWLALQSKKRSLEKNLLLYEENVSIYQERFKEGVGLSNDVNTAELELQQARASYNEVKYRQLLEVLRFRNASGLKW